MRVPVLLSVVGYVLAMAVGAAAADGGPAVGASAFGRSNAGGARSVLELLRRVQAPRPRSARGDGRETARGHASRGFALGALLAPAVLLEYVRSRTMLVVGAPLLVCCLAVVRATMPARAARSSPWLE